MLRLVLLCIFALCVPAVEVRAASLFGKVIDVSSGDVITVFNMNRPVRVRLLGIDAPEMDQTFGDVAKKHLADLVHDKSVLVEYSGIAADHSVAGRVLLNEMDIGAQMIRDGVAWLDPNHVNRLSATDREIYQQSEQAARSERRGLWEAENPVAPWEFVKAKSLKKYQYPTQNSKVTTSAPRKEGQVSELTNLTLMARETNAPGRGPVTRGDIRAAWEALTPTSKNWSELRPEGQNFSVLVPEEGRQLTYPVHIGQELVDITIHVARDGASVFAVLWLTGPTLGEPDKAAIEDTVVNGFIKGFHTSYQRGDRGEFSCPRMSEKNISTNGYTGREFDLSSCSLPTRARAFTKVVGDRRQMYFSVVFYGDENETVSKFIKSFTVVGEKSKTSQPSK